MYVNILNESYDIVYVLDIFESLSWSDRYNEVGKFELSTLANMTTLSYLKKGLYVQILESDKLMIIETVCYISDSEEGDKITISGRSLESILGHRVIANEITLDGPIQEGILSLLNENIIDPEDKNRVYPIITFRKTTDENILKIEHHGTYLGENLLDVITEICQYNNIGFRMLPNIENGGFIFELYIGTDRSYNQTTIPPVVFSPEYENLVNSNYIVSDETMKNVVYVNNENDDLKLEVYSGFKFDFENSDSEEIAVPKGRNRRESYVNSSVTVPEETPYGPAERYIDREEHGHWEIVFDEFGYLAAVEKRKAQAREEIIAAGGTEADINWPPPGREGQSYEDYCAMFVSEWDFKTEEFVPDDSWNATKLSAEELAQRKFNIAMSDPIKYSKYEMREEGFAELLKNRTTKSFDGDIINYLQFVIGKDYYLGDVVQMVNGLFVNVATRLTEVTYSYDGSGLQVIPTFTTDQDMEIKEEL